jgi:uncharacterized membrane protein YjfL (UPF0719 family)
MKISEILKGVITVLKYIFVFYLILNLVAYIYFYISQPKEMSRSKRQETAFDLVLAGNALLYMLLTDIVPSTIKNKARSNSVLPYNSVSSIHHTNAY